MESRSAGPAGLVLSPLAVAAADPANAIPPRGIRCKSPDSRTGLGIRCVRTPSPTWAHETFLRLTGPFSRGRWPGGYGRAAQTEDVAVPEYDHAPA
jgi:hypothetical protein